MRVPLSTSTSPSGAGPTVTRATSACLGLLSSLAAENASRAFPPAAVTHTSLPFGEARTRAAPHPASTCCLTTERPGLARALRMSTTASVPMPEYTFASGLLTTYR